MTLTGFEAAWIEAEMQAIFPGSADDGLRGIGTMDVRGFLARLMGHMPLRVAIGFRLAIWIVALAPLFVLGRPATIASLAPSDRESVVGRVASSRVYVVRALVLMLKTLGALLYTADDAVRARMNAPAAPKSLVLARIKPMRHAS